MIGRDNQLMVLPLLATAILQTNPSFQFSVTSGNGLSITANGVPVVLGSTLQYFENGWVKGYFTTSTSPQTVSQLDPDTIKVSYSGYNGIGTGTILYHREGSHLKAHYDMHWSADDPAEIELTAGYISVAALHTGHLSIMGNPTRPLSDRSYSGGGDMERRKYGPEASEFQFDSPLTKLGIRTSAPSTLFDARGYEQDYAQGRDILWFGLLKLDVSRQKPAQFDVDFEVQPSPIPPPKSETIDLKTTVNERLIEPVDHSEVQVPKPTVSQLDPKNLLEWTGNVSWPAGHVRFWESEFLGTLAKRFQLGPAKSIAVPVKVDGGVSKLGLHPGGYQITITDHSISVLGEEEEGLHNGLRRLARLAFAKDGKVYLPTGYLRDSPKLKWRGVHLFVGDHALAFQQRLWDRVLTPMGFNKVVLQCERTAWDSTPHLKNKNGVMTKADLVKLFNFYRAIGVEPIPLIQSFGHMEWFFADGANSDLAMNSKEPYALDPRNPLAKERLARLWDEVCNLLHPSMVHFGCDEVDMVGFPNEHESLTTELWTTQMPILKQIADRNQAKMMIWGDEGLAPGQAIDATNGESMDTAAKRRASIPKGAWIADWHYRADKRPESFLPSLQLWKKEDFVPIASTWFQPDNIRSFDIAADVEKSGSLQTTWCGYFSDESNMDEAFEQFSAMVLAGEYSWSSRMDSVDKLGYDPSDQFRHLYFETPRPIAPRTGNQFWKGSLSGDLLSRDTHYAIGDPIELRSLISAPNAPTDVQINVNGKGSHLCLAMNTANGTRSGVSVADLVIHCTDGTSRLEHLKYGQQVASAEDSKPCSRSDRIQQYSLLEIPLEGTKTIKRLEFKTTDPAAGLRIYSIAVW